MSAVTSSQKIISRQNQFFDAIQTFRLCQPVGWLGSHHAPPSHLTGNLTLDLLTLFLTDFVKGALLLLPLVLAPHPPSTMLSLALTLATLLIGATAQVDSSGKNLSYQRICKSPLSFGWSTNDHPLHLLY